jgi:hypothetical protein
MADRSGFTDYVEEHSGRLLRSAYLLTQDWARAGDLLVPSRGRALAERVAPRLAAATLRRWIR